MFTPPPSPLPPPSPYSEKKKQLAVDYSDDDEELEYFPYHDASSSPSTPTAGASFSSSVSTSPSKPTPSKKASRRRIIIPLLAVVLVLVAVASHFRVVGVPVSQPSAANSPARPHDDDVRPSHTTPRSKSHSRKRQAAVVAASPDASPGLLSTTSAAALASSTALSSVAPAIPNPPAPVPTPFPQSFDTTFSNNFTTSSCQSFFSNSILSNTTYRQCRPMSLLLPSSAAFFQAQSNLTLLTTIIGGTCNTVRTEADCVDTMGWLASSLQLDTVCAKDLAARNALVLQALNGFRNYQFMREAGCLVNQRTNSYCFVDAVASTSASDFYFYTLPLGTPLPNKTTPSCSACVQSLMGIYAAQAMNGSLDISKTYPPAAVAANAVCGQQYATVVESASFGVERMGLPGWSGMAVVTALGIILGVAVVGL